mmetsp:Transcript_5242/g.32974  ORF Transcript_5242/g.32974 Transcript_5242/m.32974 type:complete len:100 (+) Transcript_5242:474-773(+)
MCRLRAGCIKTDACRRRVQLASELRRGTDDEFDGRRRTSQVRREESVRTWTMPFVGQTRATAWTSRRWSNIQELDNNMGKVATKRGCERGRRTMPLQRT